MTAPRWLGTWTAGRCVRFVLQCWIVEPQWKLNKCKLCSSTSGLVMAFRMLLLGKLSLLNCICAARSLYTVRVLPWRCWNEWGKYSTEKIFNWLWSIWTGRKWGASRDFRNWGRRREVGGISWAESAMAVMGLVVSQISKVLTVSKMSTRILTSTVVRGLKSRGMGCRNWKYRQIARTNLHSTTTSRTSRRLTLSVSN